MPTLYEIVDQACFKEDYSLYKRELERDQVSSEKAFWMAAIQLINTHDKFSFFQIHKLYVDLLYDRPALELQLARNLSEIDDISPSLTQSDQHHLTQKIQTAKYIRGELTDILFGILEDCDQKPTKIRLSLSKNHQPYLPSPNEIINHLYAITQTTATPITGTYPNSSELSLSQLNVIRKKANSYFPFFLLRISLDKLSSITDGNDQITFREFMKSPSVAVKTHISRYPWEINLTDTQLGHIIANTYSRRKTSANGSNIEDIFDEKSIQKAITRYRKSLTQNGPIS